MRRSERRNLAAHVLADHLVIAHGGVAWCRTCDREAVEPLLNYEERVESVMAADDPIRRAVELVRRPPSPGMVRSE